MADDDISRALRIRVNGRRALLMHSADLADPLHPKAQFLADITKKRTKTDADLEEQGRREWLGGVYYDDEIGPYIPGENIEACIRDGAKFHKLGKDVTRAVILEEEFVPVDYDGPRDTESLLERASFTDRRTVKVGQSRVVRVRPRFPKWSLDFTILYDEERINRESIIRALNHAGRFVGLGDFRPKFGRFDVEVLEG